MLYDGGMAVHPSEQIGSVDPKDLSDEEVDLAVEYWQSKGEDRTQEEFDWTSALLDEKILRTEARTAKLKSQTGWIVIGGIIGIILLAKRKK